MARFVSEKSTELVGQLTELSSAAPAAVGDYIRCDGSVFERADYPLVAQDPIYYYENGVSGYVSSDLPFGSPGAGYHLKTLCVSPDGSFIACGYSTDDASNYRSSLWKSPDGVKWKVTKAFVAAGISVDHYVSVRTVNGAVFACIPSDGLYRSTDNGDTWTKVLDGLWYSIAYFSGNYYVANGTNTGLKSSDLATWTPFTFYAADAVYELCANTTALVGYVSSGTAHSYTTDGTTWGRTTLATTITAWYTNFVANDIHISLANTSFSYSANGTAWSTGNQNAPTNGYCMGVIYDGSRYIFPMRGDATYRVLYSFTTGLSTTATQVLTQSPWTGAAYARAAHNGSVALWLTQNGNNQHLGSIALVKSAFALSDRLTNDADWRPIPSLGVFRQTLSGRKYLFNKNSITSNRPQSIFLEGSDGYLAPLLSTNTAPAYGGSGYFVGTGDSNNYLYGGYASYENGVWTLGSYEYDGSNYDLIFYTYNGAITSTSTSANFNANTFNGGETQYGIVFAAQSTSVAVMNGSTAQYSHSSLITNNATSVSISYDGTIILSGSGTTFTCSISTDGGKTWNKNLTPYHYGSDNVLDTLSTNTICRVNGEYVSNMGIMYRGKNVSRLDQVTGIAAFFSASNSSTYEYTSNRVVGKAGSLAVDGSTLLGSGSSNISALVSGPVTFGDKQVIPSYNNTTTQHGSYLFVLPFEPDTQFKSPYVAPTSKGKNYYVKAK